jgi:glycerol-3-phosphate dehydrogenase
MTKVAVFGAGSWGTAFATVLAQAGHQVSVWGRRESLCEAINTRHENPDYLPGLRLPDAITATHDPAAAADGAEAIVLVVPSQSLRENLSEWAALLPPAAPLVSLMKGVELGGATKNVIAMAVGMAAGLGFGDNARASLITRGLAETARLGSALGADEHTFSGLAGLGDLVASCSSPLARNRSFGEKLGQGMTVAEIAGATRQVAEGVKSCASISELAHHHDVEMPIAEHVTKVVSGEMTPKDMLFSLVSRSAKSERWG